MLAIVVPGGPTVHLPSSLDAAAVVSAVCSQLGFEGTRAGHLALKSVDGIELAPNAKVNGATGLTLMPRPSVFVITLPVSDDASDSGGDSDEDEEGEENKDVEEDEEADEEEGYGEEEGGEPSAGAAVQPPPPEPLRFAVTGHVTGAQLASHVSKASGIPVEELRFVDDAARPWDGIIKLDPATALWQQGHTGVLRWAAVRVPPETINVEVTLHAGPSEGPRVLAVEVRAQASTTFGDVRAALLALPQLANARLYIGDKAGYNTDSGAVLGRLRSKEAGCIGVTAHIGPLALTVSQALTEKRVPVAGHLDDRVGALKLAAIIACGRKEDDASGLFLRYNGAPLDDDAALKSCSGLTDGAFAVVCLGLGPGLRHSDSLGQRFTSPPFALSHLQARPCFCCPSPPSSSARGRRCPWRAATSS